MAQISTDQAMRAALEHHQAGRLAEAEKIYRQVLALQPNHPDALNLLGAIANQVGQNDAAVELIRRAVFLRPDFAEAHCNLGNALWALGNFDEAATACRRAIQLMPGLAQAHANLGNVLTSQGHFEEAVTAYHRTIQLRPGYAEAHFNLGNCFKKQNKLDAAVTAYQIAIQINPAYAEAYSNLGVVLQAKKRQEEAVAALRKAVELAPELVAAYVNLGGALQEMGKVPEAIAAYRHAIQLNPADAQAFYKMGNALGDQEKFEEAVSAYREAVRLNTDYFEARSELGTVLKDQGKLDAAVTAFRDAISAKPTIAEVHWNLAISLLLMGDFSEGWPEFEWRWKCKSVGGLDPGFSQPQWKGEPLNGRTILLHAEQGLGDTLQFVRYVPAVAARGARVILRCPRVLHPLLSGLPGAATVLTIEHPLPPFDLHCPLLSLPLAFGTTLESIPNSTPYLQADTKRIAIWAKLLSPQSSGLKVGLAWAGNPEHSNDKHRSLQLRQLASLSKSKSVRFYSLQTGSKARQATHSDVGLDVMDLSHKLTNFAETAALIANLDLVITVDTAVAHLAGAMNKPVWVMLPFAPDWRWLLHREDSPWYPSMRLYRQKAFGEWDDVIARVSDCLSSLATRT